MGIARFTVVWVARTEYRLPEMVATRVGRSAARVLPSQSTEGALIMGAEDNVKKIQSMYEAFGRGDVQTLLDSMTDDIDWSVESSSATAPWYGQRQGKEATSAFFQDYGSSVEVHDFTPTAFGSNDTDVFTIIRFRATVRSTGKEIAGQLHHYVRFRDGKVYYFRGTEDTAQTEAALSS
jgi:ketosteroid isomerase-like protein